MTTPTVAVLMGSESDRDRMQPTLDVLTELGVPHEVHVLSAHRQPEAVAAVAAQAENRGIRVLIAGAGMANHLAGALAARTILPVIGVPLDASPLHGWDALLSTVQMPPGVPVATVAVGSAGARNAAWLAAQILALQDETLAGALRARREGSRG